MKKELIAVFPEIDYALVYLPNNSCTPYVAAWAFNGIDRCWGQGHYFRTKEGACKHIIEVAKERKPYFADKIEQKIRLIN